MPGEIVVGARLFGLRVFGLREQPVAERACRYALTGECSIPLDPTQHVHMLLAGLAAGGIAEKRAASNAELH